MSQTEQTEEQELDLNDHAALCAEGDSLLKEGEFVLAIGHYMLAMQAAPDVHEYKQKFITAASHYELNQPNENVQAALMACLQDDTIDCTGARKLWFTLLCFKDGFKDLLEQAGAGDGFNEKVFDKLAQPALLTQPFFLLGLRKIAVYSEGFERFLTLLRKALLDNLDSTAPKFNTSDFTAIAGALSHYCFYVEHIFDETPAEKPKVEALRLKAEAGNISKPEAIILGCYMPLHKIKNDAIKSILPEDIAHVQIDDLRDLAAVAKTIQPLTAITSGVSEGVRAQYEEFPYPRWRLKPDPVAEDFAIARMKKEGQNTILSAGCGTGQEVAQLALMFPNAEILAVDLSLSSIAYATRKINEFEIKNVTFRHGDILNLATLGRKFDMISSCGVLHHMQDPMKGWRVLVDLLKDDGLMRIALYSKVARRYLIQAQEAAQARNYPSTAEGMKAFRRESEKFLKPDTIEGIKRAVDYYHLSMYRDLLFHVQEHSYDTVELAAMLKELGLQFLLFSNLDPQIFRTYTKTFKRDPYGRDLKNWKAFEKAHPDTFISMFQFWCAKA